MRRVLLIAVSAPAVALALLCAAGLAARPAGGGLWPPDDVTLAEAAATGNGAEVIRLVRAGRDPNGRSRVRRDVLDSQFHVYSPLEAAVVARSPEIMTLLLRLGAAPADGDVRALWCLERRAPSNDTRAVLATLPGGPPDACE